MDSLGESPSSSEWESIQAPSTMSSLSHHDAKILLLAIRSHENNARKEEEGASTGSFWGESQGSLWDSVQDIPWSKADKLPPSLATLSAVYAGKMMLKITVAGGVILAAANVVAMGLPWWQRPAARWLMRSYAINYSWFSVGTSSMYGATEAAVSEEPSGQSTTTVVASTVG